MKLTFVAQQNKSTGCGPACIAMLIARPDETPEEAYNRAIALIFPKQPTMRRALWTQWSDLRRALTKAKIEHSRRVRLHKSFEWISGISIVKSGSRSDGSWHWTIFDGHNGMIYNPLREGPERLSNRMASPRSHLPIGPGSSRD